MSLVLYFLLTNQKKLVKSHVQVLVQEGAKLAPKS